MKLSMCVICFCLMLPFSALADIVTIHASGAVDWVSQDGLNPLTGKLMDYKISYAVPGTPVPDNPNKTYYSELLSFSATLDGQSLSTPSWSSYLLVVSNDTGASFYDDFEASAFYQGLNLSFSGISGTFTAASAYFVLRDTTEQAFSDTSLPTSFDLSDFDLPYLTVNLRPDLNGINTRVDATITSLQYSVTPTTVPEPATIVLIGLGLAGLAGMRRKTKK